MGILIIPSRYLTAKGGIAIKKVGYAHRLSMGRLLSRHCRLQLPAKKVPRLGGRTNYSVTSWTISGGANTAHPPGPECLKQALYECLGGKRREGVDPSSDRGVQYVSIGYIDRLPEAGIGPSLGSVGDSYDNGLLETIISLYKADVIASAPRRNLEAIKFAMLEWVNWFNNRRLVESIGDRSPGEVEAEYYEQAPAMKA